MEELQKTKNGICDRLKTLKDTGVRLSDIESGIGLSKNSLSGILSGIKVFPTRHIPSALEYLEQGGKRQKMKQIPLDEWNQIEAKLMELELLKTKQQSNRVEVDKERIANLDQILIELEEIKKEEKPSVFSQAQFQTYINNKKLKLLEKLK